MIELVIFDADGVLFDSSESNIAYYNAIFRALGEPPLSPAEEIASYSNATTQVFADRTHGDRERYARMLETARTLDNVPFLKMLRPPLELRPFMTELKKRYRLALATNRSGTVPALVEHLNLEGMFDAIASAKDKVRPKPAPDILDLCLERAGTRAARAVYVGDSAIDLEASRGAGLHFIAVGPRVTHHHRVDTIVDLPARLEALIASLAREAS
jgi:phosphoglycolate phosphatase